MSFDNEKQKMSFSFPLKTEYRTHLDFIGSYGTQFWLAQKRTWWWPFWVTIGATKKGVGSACNSEGQAIKVCESHASGEGNGTFLGVYEGK